MAAEASSPETLPSTSSTTAPILTPKDDEKSAASKRPDQKVEFYFFEEQNYRGKSMQDRVLLVDDLWQYVLREDVRNATEYVSLTKKLENFDWKALAEKVEAGDVPKVKLFGIFDGHGGQYAAEFAASAFPFELLTHETMLAARPNYEAAVRQSIINLHNILKANPKYTWEAEDSWCAPGATVSVALVAPERTVFAFLGDSPIYYWGRELAPHCPPLPVFDAHCSGNPVSVKRLIESRSPVGGYAGLLVTQFKIYTSHEADAKKMWTTIDRVGLPGLNCWGSIGDSLTDPDVFNTLVEEIEEFKSYLKKNWSFLRKKKKTLSTTPEKGELPPTGSIPESHPEREKTDMTADDVELSEKVDDEEFKDVSKGSEAPSKDSEGTSGSDGLSRSKSPSGDATSASEDYFDEVVSAPEKTESMAFSGPIRKKDPKVTKTISGSSPAAPGTGAPSPIKTIQSSGRITKLKYKHFVRFVKTRPAFEKLQRHLILVEDSKIAPVPIITLLKAKQPLEKINHSPLQRDPDIKTISNSTLGGFSIASDGVAGFEDSDYLLKSLQLDKSRIDIARHLKASWSTRTADDRSAVIVWFDH